jgi:5,10-methylene-tetrahydrofolate dehydrogenase/methenyl tetrahydrofolate cyclohydrolase
MHFEGYEYSNNGLMTIKAKNGQRLGCRQTGMKCPTDLDIKKINIVYNCSKKSEKKGIIIRLPLLKNLYLK